MGVYKPYLYKVGEIVNETLIIVKQIRVKHGKYTDKGYIVKSAVYKNATPYEIRESNLALGTGCAYVKGNRVCEENSLWSVKNIRDNIVDIERAKNTSRGSGKKMLFKCAYCDNKKMMVIQSLVRQGFACENCSSKASYPERFFTAYLNQYSIKYEYQVRFNDLCGYIFDYKIILNDKVFLVETHGLQHYLTEDRTYYKVETIQKSDRIKRQYAKDNNINLIELDCRESTFDFIQKQINENKHLPSILPKDKDELRHRIKESSKYNTKDIINMYTIDKLPTRKIAEKFNLSQTAIYNVLQRNGVELRCSGKPKSAVRCIETGKEYTSMKEAQRFTGISNNTISRCCRGTQKTAGGYTWEFID